jgi:hypothetical protein
MLYKPSILKLITRTIHETTIFRPGSGGAGGPRGPAGTGPLSLYLIALTARSGRVKGSRRHEIIYGPAGRLPGFSPRLTGT